MGTNLNSNQDNVSTEAIMAMTLLIHSRHMQLVVRVSITMFNIIRDIGAIEKNAASR